LGTNEHGLAAGILNRGVEKDTKVAGARSRGLLCLDILRLKTPAQVCSLLEEQQGFDYRPFNLFFADEEAFFVAYNQEQDIVRVRLQKGLHVLCNTSVYDASSAKMNHAYPLFSSVADNRGLQQDLYSWVRTFRSALSDHRQETSEKDAICVHTPSYGTVSSSIIFYNRPEKRFDLYHTIDAPCRGPYQGPVTLKTL
jgi:uncharacterized protein with NRDE domain